MSNNNKEKWFLWIDKAYHPAMNMAIDEELLTLVDNTKIPVLRFYSWDRPSISIGYVQNYASVAVDGYSLVRRPTGGGVVFHDRDLTYTVIIPSEHRIEGLNREDSYYLFHDLIVRGLDRIGINTQLVKLSSTIKERSSMHCFTSPVKFDVALLVDKDDEAAPPPKIAGAAQRRTKNGILHQGSIVLPDISSKRETLIESIVFSFTKNLGIEFSDFKPDEFFFSNAASLAASKYETDSWNKSRNTPKKRFSFRK